MRLTTLVSSLLLAATTATASGPSFGQAEQRYRQHIANKLKNHAAQVNAAPVVEREVAKVQEPKFLNDNTTSELLYPLFIPLNSNTSPSSSN